MKHKTLNINAKNSSESEGAIRLPYAVQLQLLSLDIMIEAYIINKSLPPNPDSIGTRHYPQGQFPRQCAEDFPEWSRRLRPSFIHSA